MPVFRCDILLARDLSTSKILFQIPEKSENAFFSEKNNKTCSSIEDKTMKDQHRQIRDNIFQIARVFIKKQSLDKITYHLNSRVNLKTASKF